MDVQGLVKAVTTAYEDALKLVARIRDQRANTDRALEDEPTRDLLESLALGPTIVKGQFDYEHRRWAEQYAVGDMQAREQMKDVLIALQMTVVIVLRTVYMDEIDVDFNALQTASDDCRVNAGVCLGQLSQRLSDQAKAVSMWPQSQAQVNSHSYPYGGMLPPVPSATPGLTHSSSQSTFSSPGYAAATPKDISDQMSNMSFGPSVRKQALGLLRTADPEGRGMRRRSSTTLAPDDVDFLSCGAVSSPTNRDQLHLPGGDDLDRASYVSLNTANNGNVSSAHRSRSTPSQQSPSSQPQQWRDREGEGERYGSDGYNLGNGQPEHQPSPGQHSGDLERSSSHGSAPVPVSVRATGQSHRTLEHLAYLEQYGLQPTLPYLGNPGLGLHHQVHELPSFSHPLQQSSFQSRQDSLCNPIATQYRALSPPIASSLPHSSPPTQPLPLRPRQPHHLMSSPMPSDSPPTSHQPLMHPTGMPQRAPAGSITAAPPIHPIRTQQVAPSNGTEPSPPPRSPSRALPHTSPAYPPSSHPSAHSASRPSTVISVPNTPLNLPTEKATQGFCRGAVRLFLQNGVPNKAFSAAGRPMGLSGMMPYWRCDKCNFEGPVKTLVSTDAGNKKKKGKEEKVFDPKVRVSMGGGVRYKWTFLAKSHCQLKSQVDFSSSAARQGEIGAFQCLFCVAEGTARGWTSGGSVSIRSRSSSSSSVGKGDGNSFPVFGNLQMFLDHLDHKHRHEQGWPSAEMLGRMKCIVGRVAGGDEDWDVNLVPVRDDERSPGRQA